ncbi:MAG: GNAT family N-acetyltransferase [Flavobacteriaceae bacterium]|nr:GNAT family N-acetyltransferase [Flavobacteriaceae bacterium]
MKTINLTPFTELETERLVLRQLNATDAEDQFILRSSAEVGKYIARDLQTDVSQSEKFIKDRNEDIAQNKIMYWPITIKGQTKLIGTICLWNFTEGNSVAEVGYDLNPEFQKIGIMSEALKTVVSYGFKKLKFSRIEAFTQIENEGSKLLLVKNKFQLHPTRIDEGFPKNIIFELYNKDYKG